MCLHVISALNSICSSAAGAQRPCSSTSCSISRAPLHVAKRSDERDRQGSVASNLSRDLDAAQRDRLYRLPNDKPETSLTYLGWETR